MHAPAVPPGQRLAALALAESIESHKDQIVAGWLGHVGPDALVRYPDLDRYLRSMLSGLVEVLRENDWSLTQTIIDGLAERRARAGARLEYGIQRAMLAGRYAVRPFYPDDFRHESDDLVIESLHECVFRYFESFQGVQLSSETERVHTRIIRSLVMALEARDPYTKGHSVQVALLAQRMAESLTDLMDPERAYLAGLLHDVGKVGIPDAILQKRGSLTPAEWKTMQLHPITGASILKPIKLYPEVISAVLAHHENFDGTGYPHGTDGVAIPPIGPILTPSPITLFGYE